jgi:hypothetical protein
MNQQQRSVQFQTKKEWRGAIGIERRRGLLFMGVYCSRRQRSCPVSSGERNGTIHVLGCRRWDDSSIRTY